jgi:hypothetical protein
LKKAKEIPHLNDQFQLLIEEINILEYKRNGLRTVLPLYKIKYLQQRIH